MTSTNTTFLLFSSSSLTTLLLYYITISLLLNSTMPTSSSKTIILTGASRGIGLAIARYLLGSEGHRVFLIARTREPLEGLKKEFPGRVEYLVGDVKDLEVCVILSPSSSLLSAMFCCCFFLWGEYLGFNYLLSFLPLVLAKT